MNHVLILAGILSIPVAAGNDQAKTHRDACVSSLENMGLVALALGVGGYGYYAALLLVVLHSLAKSSLFYQMGQLSRILHTFKLDDSGRYMKLYPAGAMVLMTGMISILAIPLGNVHLRTEDFRAMVDKTASGSSWPLLLSCSLILLCREVGFACQLLLTTDEKEFKMPGHGDW
jgi:hydrogenase-4 component F